MKLISTLYGLNAVLNQAVYISYHCFKGLNTTSITTALDVGKWLLSRFGRVTSAELFTSLHLNRRRGVAQLSCM
jgi:exosortase/archaeosortase